MPLQSVMLTKLFRLSPIPLIELYKAEMYSTKSFCSRDSSVDRENLHWPNGITQSANVIIIADGGNHRIVVFANRGNFSHAFRHHLLSRPYGICIRHDRYSLIVTDTSRISGVLVRIKDNLTDQLGCVSASLIMIS